MKTIAVIVAWVVLFACSGLLAPWLPTAVLWGSVAGLTLAKAIPWDRERRRKAAVLERMHAQHRAWLNGDDRTAFFGQHQPPEMFGGAPAPTQVADACDVGPN